MPIASNDCCDDWQASLVAVNKPAEVLQNLQPEMNGPMTPPRTVLPTSSLPSFAEEFQTPQQQPHDETTEVHGTHAHTHARTNPRASASASVGLCACVCACVRAEHCAYGHCAWALNAHCGWQCMRTVHAHCACALCMRTTRGTVQTLNTRVYNGHAQVN